MNKHECTDAKLTDAEITEIWFGIWIREFKVAVAFFIVAFLCGCGEQNKGNNDLIENGVEIVTIDGCQYLKWRIYGIQYYSYAHKGNCTNLIHIYRDTK